MMKAANIRKHLVRQPFKPFRIWLSDGRSLEVQHPDMCMLTPQLVYVGIPHPDEDGVALDVIDCAIMHVTSIEPINGKSNKSKNGRKR